MRQSYASSRLLHSLSVLRNSVNAVSRGLVCSHSVERSTVGTSAVGVIYQTRRLLRSESTTCSKQTYHLGRSTSFYKSTFSTERITTMAIVTRVRVMSCNFRLTPEDAED